MNRYLNVMKFIRRLIFYVNVIVLNIEQTKVLYDNLLHLCTHCRLFTTYTNVATNNLELEYH